MIKIQKSYPLSGKDREKRSLFTTFFALFLIINPILLFAQNQQVTLSISNATLKQFLNEIGKQTPYTFTYRDALINEKETVTLNVVNEDIATVLDRVLPSRGLQYDITGNSIQIIQATQQEMIHIKGMVLDHDREPIIGANVVQKGTTNGIITNIEGEFTLTVPRNSRIVVSYVGYISQEIVPRTNDPLTVVLSEDLMALEDIVVIGYGTAKRQDFTGSVSSLKLENSAQGLSQNTNALQFLKGTVPGVNIGGTASPGGQPSMLIRGQNSINGSNDPLIVLDGVIYLGSLNDINPSDIATFDVLKDAVSAAVYGSRAANGIIAITTRRGRSEKPVINFNTSVGFQTWPNRPTVMGTDQWVQRVNDVAGYPEGTTSWMKSGELANYEAGIEHNWLDLITRTGMVQDYQMSVSGAAKQVNYYVSAAYSDNLGVVKGNEFNRISVLGKINATITDWLSFGADASYSRRDHSGIGADVGLAQKMSPVGVLYRDNENNLERWPRELGSQNPLWGVDDGTRDNMDIRTNFRLNSYMSVDIPWVKGLNYRLSFTPNLYERRLGSFNYEGYYISEGNGIERYSPASLQNLLSRADGSMLNQRTYSYVVDNILSYKNTFGKHSVEATLVATRDYEKNELLYATGSDFSDNGNTSLGMWGLHKATVHKIDLDNGNSISAYKKTNIGYLGRVNYNYNSKYYLTASLRRDGASVFGTQKKWGNFAAVGGAWRISGENFMLGKIPQLDDLKLKLSFGQNGNQGVSPYTTLSKVTNGSNGGIRYQFDDTGEKIFYGLVQNSLGNALLGWESTDVWNTGFESSLFGGRLSLDMDLYFSRTKDQIFQRKIPIMTGFGTMYASMGQINNRGIELSVTSTNISKRNFTWMTGITFWKNNNKLVKLYGEDLDGDGKEDDDIANSLFIGKSLGAIYGYKQIGIVQEDDHEYMELTGSTPGSPKYADLDGVPGITSDDRTILGYDKENFRLNMSNTLRYKEWELYVLITGIFGGNNKYMKSNPAAYLTGHTGMFMDNMTYKPYWTSENRSNEYPSASFAGDGRFQGLQTRTFVRLQDITLSYNFKAGLLKKANIQTFKIFLTAQNVATFTSWEGLDPETGRRYLENYYPMTATYSIGLNLSF